MVFSSAKLKEIMDAYDFAIFLARRMMRRESRTSEHHLMPDSSSRLEHFARPDLRELGEEPSSDSPEDYLCIKPEPEPGQVGTAGFDLRVGQLISWSDTLEESVDERDLAQMPHKELEPGEKFILEHDPDGDKAYYITSFERVSFSPNLEILVDSKSTTGRVGGMSHHAGFTMGGKIITVIQPYAFPLQVTCGKTRLAQAVVRYKNTPYMTNEEVLGSNEIDFSGDSLRLKSCLTPNGLLMQFNTDSVYRARKNTNQIDMEARASLDWQDYFELLEGNSEIKLDKKTLYLLGSLGVIDLKAACGILSREEAVITGTGAWGHFAGIFQPFFRGGITMEVYSHSKRKICRGDRAGVVRFDKVQGVISPPENYGGSYQDQTPPRLPKMFKT